jgi:hypothetical protein
MSKQAPANKRALAISITQWRIVVTCLEMRCIACKTATALVRERANTRRAYCGRECQREFYTRIGVGNDDDVITLECSTGETFRITKKQADASSLLRDIMQEVGTAQPIYISDTIAPATLKHVVDFMQKTRLRFDPLPDPEYFALLHAANYLRHAHLLSSLVYAAGPRLLLMPEPAFRQYFTHAHFRDLRALTVWTLHPTDVERFAGKFRATFVQDEFPEVRQVLAAAEAFFADQLGDLDNWAIRSASRTGNVAIVEFLLNARSFNGKLRVFPAAYENDALHYAESNGHVEVVKLLIAARNDAGRYWFAEEVLDDMMAGSVLYSSYDMFNAFFDAKDENGSYRVSSQLPMRLALEHAISRNKKAIVEKIVNARTENDRSFRLNHIVIDYEFFVNLAIAIRRYGSDAYDMIKVLINAKNDDQTFRLDIDPEIANQLLLYAADAAAQSGYHAVVELLSRDERFTREPSRKAQEVIDQYTRDKRQRINMRWL